MSANDTPDLLPVRMLNEYAFCPRLFHLMHVDGRWDDNFYTDQGRSVHRRTDAADDPLPPPVEGGDEPPAVARSVSLGSEALGLAGKLDLVETEGNLAVPVETKRGAVPDNPLQSYEPERVQLMAQGLLLREHGFRCFEGMLYFAASRRRVHIVFDEALEARTRLLLAEARAAACRADPPPPLTDSPKCGGCSLAGICLPDETRLLAAPPAQPGDIRRLDPHWGFLHRPRHGRPALALDLMEEFRPLIVDSAVLSAVNTGMVAPGDFVTGAGGCAMKDAARKALIRAYEMRLDQMVTHPVFDYRCSWRAVIRVQARLLAKTLRGDVPAYTGITTR